jgi:hypothetical protein
MPLTIFTYKSTLSFFERVPGTSVWWPSSAHIRGAKEPSIIVAGFAAPLSFLNAYRFRQDMPNALLSSASRTRLIALEATGILDIDFTARPNTERPNPEVPRARRRFHHSAPRIHRRPRCRGPAWNRGRVGTWPHGRQRRRGYPGVWRRNTREGCKTRRRPPRASAATVCLHCREQPMTRCMVRPSVARGFHRSGGIGSRINVSGLRLERFVLRAIMDISAPAFSLPDRPRTGHLGHQG